MKLLCTIAFMMMASIANAEDTAPKMEQKFEDHKKEALANIDKHISAMQEHKTCVTNAKDKDAMKACHEKMKSMRMEFRDDRMEDKHERMEERMKKHEEKMKEHKDKMGH